MSSVLSTGATAIPNTGRRSRRRSSASHIHVGSYTRNFKPSIEEVDAAAAEVESITSSQVRDQAAGLSSMAFDYNDSENVGLRRPSLQQHVSFQSFEDQGYSSPVDSSPSSIKWAEQRVTILRQITHSIPAVFIGLLLNILDALSYGMILFPLSVPVFSHLGPAGLSMFYVSCIVAQLVYSLGGSKFKSGVGSEMIEVVPFFHSMAFSILNQVGEDNADSVIATTIFSFAISSMVTGIVFLILGFTNLGALVGFFPRHILMGCIGGVGWFLVATGMEVSAQLDISSSGSLFHIIRSLFNLETLPKWTIPLVLALCLMFLQRLFSSPVILPAFFIAIFALFHFIVFFLPVTLDDVRNAGYLFVAPASNEPWYSFYKLYKFSAVDMAALGKTVPAMLALTFFGLLHVPINVPALAIAIEDDHIDVSRELIAHGISNFLSGALGSIQNYLVYTNSLFFIKSGADSRFAGVLLAIATFFIMLTGPSIISIIPIMLVAALIFLLGFELLLEALETYSHVTSFEYITILIIIIVMGVKDFVYGILIGIILACVSFVIQASTTSAIKAQYTGSAARSNVRRHYMQHKFLTQVSSQTYVMKLAGYLFFGTVVNVEATIRSLIEESNFIRLPIRFLIVDLTDVTQLDYSASEAFVRIKRLLDRKHVHLLLSGKQSLRISFDKDCDEPVYDFPNVNTALEWCENELLKAYYSQTRRATYEALSLDTLDSVAVNVPQGVHDIYTASGSPRSKIFERAVKSTAEEDQQAIEHYRNMNGSLAIFHRIFQGIADKDDAFWKAIIPYFERLQLNPGVVLFTAKSSHTAFYLVEKGILRADYEFKLGHIYESILPGTTCGELPFFSHSGAAATVTVEVKSTVWKLTSNSWEKLKKAHPIVANEVLTIVLKLAAERFKSITESALVG